MQQCRKEKWYKSIQTAQPPCHCSLIPGTKCEVKIKDRIAGQNSQVLLNAQLEKEEINAVFQILWWVTHRIVGSQSKNLHFTPQEEIITKLLAAGYARVFFGKSRDSSILKTQGKYRKSSNKDNMAESL